MTTIKNNFAAYLLLLAAQLMVGICIVSAKALLTNLTPAIILPIRFTIGFLFLLFIHLIVSKEKFQSFKKLTRNDWFFIIAQALCAGAFFNILLLLGLKYTSASEAGIITSALPAIVAIFAIIFLKEHLTFFTSLCIIFAVLGLIIINAHNFHVGQAHNIVGDILILAALLPEAAYYVLAKIHHNKLPIFLISSLMNGINVPLFLLFVLFHPVAFPTSFSVTQILLLLTIGIGSGLFYVFWFLGCKNVGGTAAGLSTAFTPIATLLVAWIFLHETISMLQLAGMILVILSIVVNVRGLK